MDLLTIINTEKIIPVKEAIRSTLQGLNPDEQLSKLIDFFQVATERDVQLSELIAEAWDYLNVNSLWNTRYSSLEALKQDIDYDYALRHILDRHQANLGRRKGEMCTILDNWRHSPDIALPSDLQPPTFSDKILRYLATLSRICTLDTAIPLLRLSVQARRSTPGLPKHQYLLRGDVLNVVMDLRTKPKLQMPKTSSQLQVKAQVASQQLEDDESGNKTDKCSSTLPACDHGDHQMEDMNNTAEDKETDQEGDVNMEDDSDDNDSDYNDNGRSDSGNDGRNDKASQEAIQLEVAHKKPRLDCCSCPVGVKKLISNIAVSPEASHQAAALSSLREMALFESVCRNHLRSFAGNALDMVTNITTAALLERLEWIYPRKRQMVDVRRVRPSWFRGQSGDVWRETLPVFVKGDGEDFHFDAAKVFDRFAGQGSWERWLQDGTLILPGIFGHLQRVKSEIDSEFDMYNFHLGKQPGLPTMGWMRNMYHSGPQQLMYQDPILWALTAAARPDKHWRLIAYPYNAKNAVAGLKTGFLHLDLDLKRHHSEGLGKNMVQSSVSLTDEDDKGCTLVIPGFHRRFQEWVRTKRDMIDSRASHHSTTDMKAMYTAEDKVRFGRPIPAPCPAWGVRLSRSDIIHGSSDEGTQLRRVMSPWFTAINPDHKAMENPDCMNWDELSRCHKDLVGPTKESLGDQPRKGVAGVRFPGAIPVRSAYSVPQALVGLKEWTEPDVIFERNILLGPDDNQALELAENIRNQLVDTYKYLYPLMEFRERQAFGNRSSFAENNVAQDGDEDIELEEDSE